MRYIDGRRRILSKFEMSVVCVIIIIIEFLSYEYISIWESILYTSKRSEYVFGLRGRRRGKDRVAPSMSYNFSRRFGYMLKCQ